MGPALGLRGDRFDDLSRLHALWILLPVILGFPIIATIVNMIKGQPLLRKGPLGLPWINYDIEDRKEVPSMNLTARSLEDDKT